MTASDALDYVRAWGFEPVAATELRGGYSNASYRVTLSDGGSVVARRYGRLHVSRNAVFYEHAVQRYTAARSDVNVAPYEDADGETLRRIDGAFVAVLPYAVGETGRREHLESAATLLASFHRATVGFHAARPRVTRSLGTLGWLRHRFVRFAADPSLARALDWDALIVAVAGATARLAPRVAQLPLGVVHGDPHCDNVVSRDGAARALIDFDFVHETERAYDVATAADAYARAGEDAPLDPVKFLAFARAYDALAPLTAAEWASLWDLAIRRHAMTVWYVVTRHGERSRGDVGGAPRYVARARELDRFAHDERGARA